MPARPRPWRSWESRSSATSGETTSAETTSAETTSAETTSAETIAGGGGHDGGHGGARVAAPRPTSRAGPWGELAEIAPEHCPNGHPFGPNRVLVGWAPCSCPGTARGRGGHRTYSCRACGATIYRPECRGATRG